MEECPIPTMLHIMKSPGETPSVATILEYLDRTQKPRRPLPRFHNEPATLDSEIVPLPFELRRWKRLTIRSRAM